MGCESNASPTGKRGRDAEDEVYLDNFHSQKRYLSEVMASSLNGLNFGESLVEHLMESPASSEGICNSRDDVSLQYSPMSEDFDDARYAESPFNSTAAQADSMPTSPVSPYRYQRPLSASSSTAPTTSHSSLGCNLAAVSCSPSRQRNSDSEGRLPSSPSDICYPADLRRAALMRALQMRSQPQAIETSSFLAREPLQDIEPEEHSYSSMESLNDERDYQSLQQETNPLLEQCPSTIMPERELNQRSSCRALDMNEKGNELGEGVYERKGDEKSVLVYSRRSLLGGHVKSGIDFK
ncbi:hypothetical protein Sjap_007319 [Stephania japonica]|uniref:Uncharacterized protein n=1 Tax=Stephania japonica TaxID=461633 RepID=A0AAP0JPM7_9MAGN